MISLKCYFFCFLFVLIYGKISFCQNVDNSYKQNLCQSYTSKNCNMHSNLNSEYLRINCLSEYKLNNCDEYLNKISNGLTGADLKEVQDSIITCSIAEICEPDIFATIGNCIKGGSYDLFFNIIKSPLQIFDLIENDKECLNDIDQKVELLEKFNLIVQDPIFQFDPIFFEANYLENISCHELKKQIQIKKQNYQASIGSLVASGKIQSPFNSKPLFYNLILSGAENLKIQYNCLKPKVKAANYCQFAAIALLGVSGLPNKIKIPKLLSANSNKTASTKYKVVSMNKKYQGEQTGIVIDGKYHRTQYLSTSAKERFEVEVKNEKLIYKKTGLPVDTKGKKALYVMDAEGKIYITSSGARQIQLNHSSILSGSDVAAAGEIKTTISGAIIKIDRNSGHYRPSSSHLNQIVEELRTRGMRLNSNQISYHYNH